MGVAKSEYPTQEIGESRRDNTIPAEIIVSLKMTFLVFAKEIIQIVIMERKMPRTIPSHGKPNLLVRPVSELLPCIARISNPT